MGKPQGVQWGSVFPGKKEPSHELTLIIIFGKLRQNIDIR